MLRNIEESQLARAFSQDFSADLPGEDCPSAEELWMACTLELDLEARTKIIDHCISCAHCAQEMRMTREMVAEHNELLLGAPANSLPVEEPKLSLAEQGASIPLRIVEAEPAEPANQGAQEEQDNLVSLGAWRRNLNKVTAACGVLAAAAAVAFIVVKERNPGTERSAGAWRGQDAHGEAINHRFLGNTFSWPAVADVEHYELEIKGTGQNSDNKCVQTVQSNRFVFDPSLCPGLSVKRPFFWRVRPVTKQGHGEFSRFFSVKVR